MKFFKLFMIISATAVVLTACGDKPTVAKETAVQAKEEIKLITGQKTLLFFINPAGAPCKMQNRIIDSAKEEIEELSNIVYIKTTNPANREHFYSYGIRAIPAIIVVNDKNEEVKRFTPGIHSKEDIIEALK